MPELDRRPVADPKRAMAQKLFFRLNEVVDETAPSHGMTRVDVLRLVRDFLTKPPTDRMTVGE